VFKDNMPLAGGHTEVPFYHQGLLPLGWLRALEMLMSYRHGSRYGRNYRKDMGGPVQWGDLRPRHTPYVLRKQGLFGWRVERGSLKCGSRMLDHVVDYGLRAVDALKGETRLEVWQAVLADGPVLAEGRFGIAWLTGENRVVVLVGWNAKGKIAYQDSFSGNRLFKYSYCTLPQLAARTATPASCFWRAL
jgi:hypothetical protein